MNTFRIGDYVKLKYVDESDMIFGRYKGEVGIYQGADERYTNYSYVRFGNFGQYIVKTNSLMLEKPADLDSIFKAFGEDIDGYEKFRDTIKNFYENR